MDRVRLHRWKRATKTANWTRRGVGRLAPLLAASSAWATPLSAAQRHALARHYLYGGLAWQTLNAWLLILVLWLLARTRGGERAHEWLKGRLNVWLHARWQASAPSPRSARLARWGAAALFYLGLFALILLVEFPVQLYVGFFRERAFGFQHRTLPLWLGQWGESAAVELLLTVLCAAALQWLVRAWPRLWTRAGTATAQPRAKSAAAPPPPPPATRRWFARAWWLPVWLLAVGFMTFSVVIEPVWIEPLFNTFTPLPASPVKTEMLSMAARAGVPAHEIYVANRSRQSGHTNAYVTGLGRTRRVVFYDTLLKVETPAEQEFTLGHELGHAALHHVAKSLAFAAALTLVLFLLLQPAARWFARHGATPESSLARAGRDAGSLAALPGLLFVLALLLWLSSPLTNGFSRHVEHQADAFGLALAPQPCAAITAFEKDEQTDLIDPDPPRWLVWWFFTHPSHQQRIDFARRWCQQHPQQAAGRLAGAAEGNAPSREPAP